jgi:hypothetical protein
MVVRMVNDQNGNRQRSVWSMVRWGRTAEGERRDGASARWGWIGVTSGRAAAFVGGVVNRCSHYNLTFIITKTCINQ